jgi:pyridoxal 5'-phosphate synthase pdxS subunit
MSESLAPSSNALPTTANGNGSLNGTSTPVIIHRGTSAQGSAAGGAGTFGVKTGLAQMLKGGCANGLSTVGWS